MVRIHDCHRRSVRKVVGKREILLPLTVLKSSLFVVACEGPTFTAKLFQIGFTSDGSLFVSFPYLKAGGSLGEVSLSEPATYPTDLTIGDELSATSHGVKYSHHPSGVAHFSLTKKVQTEVRKRAVRLDAAGGHVFTVTASGFHRFAAPKDGDRRKKDRLVVSYRIEESAPRELKFVGYVYSRREMAARMLKNESSSPWFAAIKASGDRSAGVCLSIPCLHGQEQLLLVLTIEERAPPEHDGHGLLTFLGGFDCPDVAGDHTKPTSFLFAGYGTKFGYDRRPGIRSIDLS